MGGGREGVRVDPLIPVLIHHCCMWCLVGAMLLSYVVLKYWICTGQYNTYYSWFKKLSRCMAKSLELKTVTLN